MEEHSALGQSPRDAYILGLAQSGMREHKIIPYDETFRILTLPTTRKGTALVQPNRGVKIMYNYYWNDVMRHRNVEGVQVPVRYDPFDKGSAWVYAEGQWRSCISDHHAVFSGRTEREIKLASQELLRRKRLYNQRYMLTSRRLAEFLVSLEAEEVLLEQRLRDIELRGVFDIMRDGWNSQTARSFLTLEPDTLEMRQIESQPVLDLVADDVRCIDQTGGIYTILGDY